MTYIKAKTTGLTQLQRFHEAIGSTSFLLLLDTISDKELASVAKPIDPASMSANRRCDRFH